MTVDILNSLGIVAPGIGQFGLWLVVFRGKKRQ